VDKLLACNELRVFDQRHWRKPEGALPMNMLQFQMATKDVMVRETDLPLTRRELSRLRTSHEQLDSLFNEAREITEGKDEVWLFPVGERPRGQWWLIRFDDGVVGQKVA
jgi:hypothetical protein